MRCRAARSTSPFKHAAWWTGKGSANCWRCRDLNGMWTGFYIWFHGILEQFMDCDTGFSCDVIVSNGILWTEVEQHRRFLGCCRYLMVIFRGFHGITLLTSKDMLQIFRSFREKPCVGSISKPSNHSVPSGKYGKPLENPWKNWGKCWLNGIWWDLPFGND